MGREMSHSNQRKALVAILILGNIKTNNGRNKESQIIMILKKSSRNHNKSYNLHF